MIIICFTTQWELVVSSLFILLFADVILLKYNMKPESMELDDDANKNCY